MGEKIKLQHLPRGAILYVSQSSTYQVHNRDRGAKRLRVHGRGGLLRKGPRV
jgi:hypothetical protein